MLGLTGLIVVYALQLDKHLRANLPFTVFVKNEADADQLKGLQKSLEAAPYSAKVTFVSLLPNHLTVAVESFYNQ